MMMWEYILVIIRSACIGTMMTLGLTYKWKEIRQRALAVFLTAVLFLAAYILLRVGAKRGARLSCDIAFTAAIGIYGIFCFQDSIRRRLFLSFGTALVTALCARICGAMFAGYPGHTDLLDKASKGISEELVILSVDIFFQFIVHGIGIAVWNRLLKIRKVAIYNIVIYLFFPLSQFMIVFFLSGRAAYDRLFANPLSVCGVLIGYIADIVFYYTIINQERKKELQRKLEETRTLYEIEKVHSDLTAAGKEEIDRLSRAFNTQLTAIIDHWEQGDQERADLLFERLKTEVAATKERAYCGNAVVNAVLAEKEKRAKEQSVRMDINLAVEPEIAVSAVHLCSVFSNMLDNAIRATAAYKGERQILVSSGYAGDYFFVSVKNRCGRPERKSIRRGHGYGLEILDDIAKQYDGTFRHQWQNETYTAEIMLLVR